MKERTEESQEKPRLTVYRGIDSITISNLLRRNIMNAIDEIFVLKYFPVVGGFDENDKMFIIKFLAEYEEILTDIKEKIRMGKLRVRDVGGEINELMIDIKKRWSVYSEEIGKLEAFINKLKGRIEIEAFELKNIAYSGTEDEKSDDRLIKKFMETKKAIEKILQQGDGKGDRSDSEIVESFANAPAGSDGKTNTLLKKILQEMKKLNEKLSFTAEFPISPQKQKKQKEKPEKDAAGKTSTDKYKNNPLSDFEEYREWEEDNTSDGTNHRKLLDYFGESPLETKKYLKDIKKGNPDIKDIPTTLYFIKKKCTKGPFELKNVGKGIWIIMLRSEKIAAEATVIQERDENQKNTYQKMKAWIKDTTHKGKKRDVLLYIAKNPSEKFTVEKLCAACGIEKKILGVYLTELKRIKTGKFVLTSEKIEGEKRHYYWIKENPEYKKV